MKLISKADIKTELYSFSFEEKEYRVRIFLSKKNIILWEVEGAESITKEREVFDAFNMEYEEGKH